jgi:hypothetical protein
VVTTSSAVPLIGIDSYSHLLGLLWILLLLVRLLWILLLLVRLLGVLLLGIGLIGLLVLLAGLLVVNLLGLAGHRVLLLAVN